LRGPVEREQYTSADYTQVLDDHEVLQSIGTVADAMDNALAESFVDSYKTELIADRVWRCRSQLELATVEYVGWFNHERLHEALGDIPPIEFEQRDAPTEPVTGLISGHGSVAVTSPRAADGLRTPRSSTLSVDLAGNSPIRAINGIVVRSAPAQAAPSVLALPTVTPGLSDRRFREILPDNNTTNQTTKEPT
jgi:Integrase core domain